MAFIRTSVWVAPVLIGLLLAGPLLGYERFAFRDVNHFYTPLYDYVAARMGSQWLPLWNPLDQTGMSLIGETTTAVFYPVRYLAFALLPTDLAMAWYVAFHLVLASLTARMCARWAGVRRWSASLVGVIYPLSGSVFFLSTNPPFLVGAAWLPLLLGPLMGRIPMSTGLRVSIPAFAMAMMVLGGDPQTALHGVMVALAVCGLRIREPDGKKRMLAMLLAPLFAAALAAPQLAASVSWSRHSARVVEHEPQSYWRPPRLGSRRYEAFQFSLPPWHLAELVSPNCSGSLLPVHRRVSQLIPGDGRMWTPTLYMGMLTALALGSCWKIRRMSPWDAWPLVAGGSLLLCCGHFGIVWLIQNVSGRLADFDSAAGGPYWFLYHGFPGYDSFRYPVKWLPVFALAAAVLTGRWLDRDLGKLAHRHRTLFAGSLVSLALALVVFGLAVWNPRWTASLPSDEFWGPLQVSDGLIQIGCSLLHTTVVLIAIALVLRQWKLGSLSRRTMRWWLLSLVAIDVGLSAYPMVLTVPRQAESSPRQAESSANSDRSQGSPESARRWMRTQSEGGWPQHWRERSDANRLVDVEASSRLAWFGRWHLSARQAVFNNMTSIQSHRMSQFWRAATEVTRGMDADENERFWLSVRGWLGIDGVSHTSGTAMLVPTDHREADRVKVRRWVSEASPIEWVSGESPPPDPDEVGNLVVFLKTIREREPTRSDSRIRVLHETAELVEYEVESEQPGWLVRSTLQDGHWSAEIAAADGLPDRASPLPVRPVECLRQGVPVPQGHWRVRFRYAPAWLRPSLWLAGTSWLALMIFFGKSVPAAVRRSSVM